MKAKKQAKGSKAEEVSKEESLPSIRGLAVTFEGIERRPELREDETTVVVLSVLRVPKDCNLVKDLDGGHGISVVMGDPKGDISELFLGGTDKMTPEKYPGYQPMYDAAKILMSPIWRI